MNIVVKTSSGKTIVRPDTTWEKDWEDFYPWDDVNVLTFTPVLFARISKPGKSIARKFASRYYDSVGYGFLLYPEDWIDGSEEGYAAASCLDHTSFLPAPFFNPVTLDGTFVMEVDGKEVYSSADGTRERIERAIEDATSHIYVRTGDLLAIELTDRQPLAKRSGKDITIRSFYCGQQTMDFRIIF